MMTHSAYYLTKAAWQQIGFEDVTFAIVHKYRGHSGVMRGEFKWWRKGSRIYMVPLGACGTVYEHEDLTPTLEARELALDDGTFVYFLEERVFDDTFVYRVIRSRARMPVPRTTEEIMREMADQLEAAKGDAHPRPRYLEPEVSAVTTRVPLEGDARTVQMAVASGASQLVRIHKWDPTEALETVDAAVAAVRPAQLRSAVRAAAEGNLRALATRVLDGAPDDRLRKLVRFASLALLFVAATVTWKPRRLALAATPLVVTEAAPWVYHGVRGTLNDFCLGNTARGLVEAARRRL
jgi:hypothetical protein